jgi:dienelactone hydrolase
MRNFCKIVIGLSVCLMFSYNSQAEPIYHENYYPDGSGPFPAVIALHTSGGFKTEKYLLQRYIDDGFSVYAPDFFLKNTAYLKHENKNIQHLPKKYREGIIKNC